MVTGKLLGTFCQAACFKNQTRCTKKTINLFFLLGTNFLFLMAIACSRQSAPEAHKTSDVDSKTFKHKLRTVHLIKPTEN